MFSEVIYEKKFPKQEKPHIDSPMEEPNDKKERLSVIIAEINSRTGKTYDNDVAIKAMLQIKDLLMKLDV